MDLRTGDVFWPVRDGCLASYPRLTTNLDADVVVIGSGITGALTAHELCERGASVVVLDRRNAGSGSTAASSGLLMYETDVELGALSRRIGESAAVRAWRMGQEAIDRLEQLASASDHSCDFARRKALYVARSWWAERKLRAECEMRQRHRFAVEWIPGGELERRYGVRGRGAILSSGDGEIDPYAFTHRMLQRAVTRGAKVFDQSEVSSVMAGRDSITAATSHGPTVTARHVVWAAGYEGVEETQRKVGRLYSTWIVLSQPNRAPAAWSDGLLIWETSRPYLYVRTTNDGRVMVGGLDEPRAERHANQKRLQRKSEAMVASAARLVPSLEMTSAHQWAGTFLATRDGLPYIGTVPEHPRAWLALGYGGNGITFSMIAARLIADAWMGRPNPDSAIFAFDR